MELVKLQSPVWNHPGLLDRAWLQAELHAMTKRGEWDRLGEVIDDEVLNTFAVIGTPDRAIAELKRRYGDIVTQISLMLPEGYDAERWVSRFELLRQSSSEAVWPPG